MVGRTVEQFGRLDFVVMNAGFAIRFEESLLKICLEKLAENMRTLFEVFPITLAMLALTAARVMAPFEPDVRRVTDPFITFHEIPFARPNAHPRHLIPCVTVAFCNERCLPSAPMARHKQGELQSARRLLTGPH